MILTIQKRVSLAKVAYWSMVDKTLKIKQTSTIMNLKGKVEELNINQSQTMLQDNHYISNFTTTKYVPPPFNGTDLNREVLK